MNHEVIAYLLETKTTRTRLMPRAVLDANRYPRGIRGLEIPMKSKRIHLGFFHSK